MMRVKEEDVIDYVVNKGNGVKGLVQNLDLHHQGLPQQYLQPPEERFDLSKVVYTDSIPIIDVSNLEDPMVAESICKAAENWGFFQIMNHGVPLQVLENMKESVHRFFELPAEEKRKYLKEYPPSSSAHLGTSFNPRVEKVLEWKDYLHLRYVSDDDASACWPPLCKDEVLEYMKRSKPVLKRLLEVLMKGLGVKEIDKTKENLLMGTIKINLNYYPICPNPELTAGVGRHSDITSLTCLLQDEIGGLYVRGRGIQAADTWIPVKPIAGSLVINIGDTLQIMSNGRYKSIEHCVVANRNKKRVSVPIFVQPGYDAVIGPLSQVLDKGEKPLYKKLLFSEYVKHFFSKAHNGKDTIDFAKI